MDAETINELQALLDDVLAKWKLDLKRHQIEDGVYDENYQVNPPDSILDWVTAWENRLNKVGQMEEISSRAWSLRGEIERRSNKLASVLPLNMPIQWGPILITFSKASNGRIHEPKIRMVDDVTAEEDF